MAHTTRYDVENTSSMRTDYLPTEWKVDSLWWGATLMTLFSRRSARACATADRTIYDVRGENMQHITIAFDDKLAQNCNSVTSYDDRLQNRQDQR